MSERLINTIDRLTKDTLVKAIINSENDRQHACKDWLIEHTENYIGLKDQFSVCVAGGWFGLMAHKLREHYGDRITKLVSFDRNKQCMQIGHMLYPDSCIKFEWQSVENFNPAGFDVIVSTSCEHFSDQVLNNFVARKQINAVVVLQNNNYFELAEHKNCKNNLQEFSNSVDLQIIDSMELETNAYTRYMIVGR